MTIESATVIKLLAEAYNELTGFFSEDGKEEEARSKILQHIIESLS
jgi:hypothetical protein